MRGWEKKHTTVVQGLSLRGGGSQLCAEMALPQEGASTGPAAGDDTVLGAEVDPWVKLHQSPWSFQFYVTKIYPYYLIHFDLNFLSLATKSALGNCSRWEMAADSSILFI